jgi:type 1 glutamine amidotransferase
MSRAVVLSGGPDYAHAFDQTGSTLADLVRSTGREVVLLDHPDAVTDQLQDSDVDVLVVNALRWRMLAERYDPWRDEWAYTSTPELRSAITSFVAGGGGLVGNHTAPICFDDWPEWADVLGGGWVWDVSSHPPLGPVDARVIRADHPITVGVDPLFRVDDEVYGDLRRHDVEVLVTARRTPDDADQPVVWAHRYGSGRSAFVCFGHDRRSLLDPNVSRLITQSIDWVTTHEETP